MKYKTLADGTQIPAVGLGTWRIGGTSSPDRSQQKDLHRALTAAFEMGYRLVDTAEMYGGGFTEELVGDALRGFNREEFFIVSKVWHTNLKASNVLAAAEGSLKRLGTQYLDLYLIHWPNQSIPLKETFRGLNELVHRGIARRVGVSNFELPLLQQAQILSETPLAANQVPYSLYRREFVENGVLHYCQENGILLMAYTPVEKGRVANDAQLQRIARRYAATPVQVALAWLVQQPWVIAIPKSTNPSHLRQNLEAADLEMSAEDLEALDQVLPRQRGR